MRKVALDCEYNQQYELLLTVIDEEVFVGVSETLVERLLSLIDEGVLFIGHNIKADVKVIYKNTGILIRNVFCTMVAFQILVGGAMKGNKKISASLKSLVSIFFDVELDKEEQSGFMTKYDLEFTPEQMAYALGDTKYLIQLHEILSAKLVDNKLKKDFSEAFRLDMEVLPILAQMEVRGCKVDPVKLQILKERWTVLMEEQRVQCHKELLRIGIEPVSGTFVMKRKKIPCIVMYEFNLNSAPQMLQLFNSFGIKPPIDKKKNRPSFGKEILAKWQIANKTVLDPFLTSYRKYKGYSKLLRTYVYKLTENDTIHTTYKQCFTATHRFSSARGQGSKKWTEAFGYIHETNLQNIPTGEEGKKLMECFCKPHEDWLVFCSDMASAELRIAAACSDDPVILTNFTGEGDFHSTLATESYKIIHGIDDPMFVVYPDGGELEKFRSLHKRVNFGILYGAGWHRIAEVLGVSDEIAKRCFNAISAKIAKLMVYLKTKQAYARKHKVVFSNSITNRFKMEPNMQQTANHEFQSTNADAMRLALILIDQHIREHRTRARVINTIHDSVIGYIHKDENPDFIKEYMAYGLEYFLQGKLKGGADIKLAEYWKK
jgi:DNA polymerase I-like protein with 3'-5' exonuclease and polymerase domains